MFLPVIIEESNSWYKFGEIAKGTASLWKKICLSTFERIDRMYVSTFLRFSEFIIMKTMRVLNPEYALSCGNETFE